jgi:hypothetical protein
MIHFTAEQEKRGLIRVDSEKGKQLGLTSDRFTEDSYLWLEGNTLWLSLLTSKKEHQGYVLNIMNNAKAAGYDMLCYSVSVRMNMILSRFGFVITEIGWLYKNEKQ